MSPHESTTVSEGVPVVVAYKPHSHEQSGEAVSVEAQLMPDTPANEDWSMEDEGVIDGVIQWKDAIALAAVGPIPDHNQCLSHDPRQLALGTLYAAMLFWAKAGLAEPDETVLWIMNEWYKEAGPKWEPSNLRPHVRPKSELQ